MSMPPKRTGSMAKGERAEVSFLNTCILRVDWEDADYPYIDRGANTYS